MVWYTYARTFATPGKVNASYTEFCPTRLRMERALRLLKQRGPLPGSSLLAAPSQPYCIMPSLLWEANATRGRQPSVSASTASNRDMQALTAAEPAPASDPNEAKPPLAPPLLRFQYMIGERRPTSGLWNSIL